MRHALGSCQFSAQLSKTSTAPQAATMTRRSDVAVSSSAKNTFSRKIQSKQQLSSRNVTTLCSIIMTNKEERELFVLKILESNKMTGSHFSFFSIATQQLTFCERVSNRPRFVPSCAVCVVTTSATYVVTYAATSWVTLTMATE